MFLLLMTQIIDELRYNNGISKIANLLDNTSNQSSKFRTKNWFEVNVIHGERIKREIDYDS